MRRFRTRFRTSGPLSRFPTDGTPTLILDFVPVADPLNSASLQMTFALDAPVFTVNREDPIQAGALLNLQVWN